MATVSSEKICVSLVGDMYTLDCVVDLCEDYPMLK